MNILGHPPGTLCKIIVKFKNGDIVTIDITKHRVSKESTLIEVDYSKIKIMEDNESTKIDCDFNYPLTLKELKDLINNLISNVNKSKSTTLDEIEVSDDKHCKDFLNELLGIKTAA